MTLLRLATTAGAQPDPDALQPGELVVSVDPAAPGLYFKDAAGDLVFVAATKVP